MSFELPAPKREQVWAAASEADRDAAKRAADMINLHLAADPSNVGCWVAIRLSDGGSDGVVYDNAAPPLDPRHHAIRHQLHETQCAYFNLRPGGITRADALIFLRYNRMVYAAGGRLPKPPVNRMGTQVLRRMN